MPKNTQTEEVHPLTGAYHNSGVVTTEEGKSYAFKCATVRKDPNGPQVRDMVPCVLTILVNRKAFQEMTMTIEQDEPVGAAS